MRCIHGFVAALALCVAAPAVLAQDAVYTWVDGSGVRHYAQTPPDGVKYEIRDVNDRMLGSETGSNEPTETRSADEVRACDRARLSLQQLNSNAALEMDKDGDGVPEPLTAEDRAQQRRLAEQSVAAYCETPGSTTPRN